MNGLLEASQTIPTYTNSKDIKTNLDAMIAEISNTKRVLNKHDTGLHNFRRFLLTLGFPKDWSIQQLRNSYFHTDNVDFYEMIIGDIPASLKQLKLRSKSFLANTKEWFEWYNNR